MNTKIMAADDPFVYKTALDILKSGGLVAFPTDTVYGVGALAFDGKAVESIYTAKDRPIEKAIPILIGEIMDTVKITTDFPRPARVLASRFWPGPLTCVLAKKPSIPEAVSATNTVGIRIPDHAVSRILLRATGPMAVTSANISGKESPSTAGEVFAQLNGRIALIIDGGKTPGGVPSTVVDCSTDEIKILRNGPISAEEIHYVLKTPR
ncbi:MAG: threonylcarbamoyl-AMP synthase [Anaerolineales bacterium]|nr:threonylcarbamoyl-AMP synthase [Anaerolineales bacterium]